MTSLLQINHGAYAGSKLKEICSHEALSLHIKSMAEEISADYEGEVPILIGILNGCIHFFSDLALALTIDCEYTFMRISSYGDALESSGKHLVNGDLNTSIFGRHVIIVEDIVDTGKTLQFLRTYLKGHEAKSIECAALFVKDENESADVKYRGMGLGDHFVVGYGLDLEQQKRNLSSIYELTPKAP